MNKIPHIARYKVIQTEYGWHFVLQSPNYRVIGVSEVYTTRQAAEEGLLTVRQLVQDKDNFRRLESKDGQHYFNLIAKNGEIVLTSEMYPTFAVMKKGIDSVMLHGTTLEVVFVKLKRKFTFSKNGAERHRAALIKTIEKRKKQ